MCNWNIHSTHRKSKQFSPLHLKLFPFLSHFISTMNLCLALVFSLCLHLNGRYLFFLESNLVFILFLHIFRLIVIHFENIWERDLVHPSTFVHNYLYSPRVHLKMFECSSSLLCNLNEYFIDKLLIHLRLCLNSFSTFIFFLFEVNWERKKTDFSHIFHF